MGDFGFPITAINVPKSAKLAIIDKCGLLNHFAKVCRKQINAKPQNSKKRAVNTVKEEPHPEDSMELLQPAKLYEADYSSGEGNTVAVIENAVEKVEPLNMPIKIGNITTTLLVDSGSACSFLNRSLASQVVQSSPRTFWISEKVPHNFGLSRTSQFLSKEKFNLQSQKTNGF